MTERRRISDENKDVARRWLEEIINAHNVALCDELYDPNYLPHSLPPGLSQNRDGFKQYASAYFQAVPDVHATIDSMIAEGDWVAFRYTAHATHQGDMMGIPATGKELTVSAGVTLRIVDSRIVEDWLDWDRLDLLQQLGIIPASAPV